MWSRIKVVCYVWVDDQRMVIATIITMQLYNLVLFAWICVIMPCQPTGNFYFSADANLLELLVFLPGRPLTKLNTMCKIFSNPILNFMTHFSWHCFLFGVIQYNSLSQMLQMEKTCLQQIIKYYAVHAEMLEPILRLCWPVPRPFPVSTFDYKWSKADSITGLMHTNKLNGI